MRSPASFRLLQCVYDVLYALLLLLGAPFVLFMLAASPRWRAGLFQRMGFCPERKGTGPALWIHGVSVGEVLAAKELVALLEREMPHVEIVLSTTTRTGHEAAERTYPGRQVIYFPLDLSFATRRVLSRIRPAMVLLMELELWPNFLLTTTLRGVPVMLANGRMSAKSARDYRFLQKFIPEPMTRVLHFCVQSEEYAARFASLGVPREHLSITGSMKFDTVPDSIPDSEREEYARLLAIAPGAFVLVAGSTHPGEEAVVLDAFREIRARDASARLVLVPRHPERLDEVESLARSRGHEVRRLSALRGSAADGGRGAAVVLVDTMGELARIYSVADLVFVGGSLTRRGGQNMMEPAGLGRAVVVGPNTWNFRDPMELLRARGGIAEVPDAGGVRATLVALHADGERRRDLAERARAVCRESKGATRRILGILKERLPPPGAPGAASPAASPAS